LSLPVVVYFKRAHQIPLFKQVLLRQNNSQQMVVNSIFIVKKKNSKKNQSFKWSYMKDQTILVLLNPHKNFSNISNGPPYFVTERAG
jgi:hypothetical protein